MWLHWAMFDQTRAGWPGRRPHKRAGGPLQPCSVAPLTGFYRDGCCNTGREIWPAHVCVLMTAELLAFPGAGQRPLDADARLRLRRVEARRPLVLVRGAGRRRSTPAPPQVVLRRPTRSPCRSFRSRSESTPSNCELVPVGSVRPRSAPGSRADRDHLAARRRHLPALDGSVMAVDAITQAEHVTLLHPLGRRR